jgi:hypothetical protein
MMLRKVVLAAAVTAGLWATLGGVAAAQDNRPGRDRACVLDCRQVYTRCSHAAYSEARMCVQGCGELIAKAREICAEAPDSEDCATARRRAAQCVRECRETLRADLRQCRADAKECVDLCPDAEPMVPADPVCLHECRRLTRSCLDRVNAAARECAAPCADLVARAKRICAGAPRSDECARARREASACLQPCRERQASQTRECIANGQRCAASCPPVVDTPDSAAR